MAELLRCQKTHNPCGTDTWAAGCACKCPACQEYFRRNAEAFRKDELAESEWDALYRNAVNPTATAGRLTREPRPITEALEELRSAGGHAWDGVGDVEGYLGRREEGDG